jgi:hypothetical protein
VLVDEFHRRQLKTRAWAQMSSKRGVASWWSWLRRSTFSASLTVSVRRRKLSASHDTDWRRIVIAAGRLAALFRDENALQVVDSVVAASAVEAEFKKK